MSTLADFFGNGLDCVNCGETLPPSLEMQSLCEACLNADRPSAARRQLAYLERIGDVDGAENVRQAISEMERTQARVEAALGRFGTPDFTQSDAHILVAAGRAEFLYGDPDSNGPTGIVLK